MRNPKGSELFSPLSEILGLYRAIRAALLPPCCRFVPSCSEYAEQAVERFGVLRSLPLILSRLLRCHPFHPGGHDPVPARPVDGAATAARA